MELGQERTGRDFRSLNNGVTYPDDREPLRAQAGGLGRKSGRVGGDGLLSRAG